jgi:S-adenosylmethionine decarboxylase
LKETLRTSGSGVSKKNSLLGVVMKKLLLGKHYICDFSGCSAELLSNSEQLHQAFVEIIENAGLTIVDEGFYKFNPYGSTSFLLLAESHASIHTWPEYKYCAIDIFTCALEKDLQPVIDELQQRLGAEKVSTRVVERNADISVTKELAIAKV